VFQTWHCNRLDLRQLCLMIRDDALSSWPAKWLKRHGSNITNLASYSEATGFESHPSVDQSALFVGSKGLWRAAVEVDSDSVTSVHE
jgi:hypothetical protein